MDFGKILSHSIPLCLRTHSCMHASFSLIGTPGFEYQCNIQLTLCLDNFLVKYSIFISFLSRLFFFHVEFHVIITGHELNKCKSAVFSL